MARAKTRRFRGEVIEWNGQKRSGFIAPNGNRPDDPLVFLPGGAFANRKRKPKVGDVVTYELAKRTESPKVHVLRTDLKAENVCFQGEEPLPFSTGKLAVWPFGLAYLAVLVVITYWIPMSIWFFTVSIVASILAVTNYALDKRAAQSNGWRIPESQLHFFAVIGGWPGAAAAQKVLRHKILKQDFQLAFRICILVNLLVVFTMLSLIANHAF
jgi:uncharacterized membrane protein YsdA (DUF1294 family)